MDKTKSLNALPLEFQKINVETKILANEVKERKSTVSVDFYQSENIIPDFFYKPISKVINFDACK